jgi:hypothetical protein
LINGIFRAVPVFDSATEIFGEFVNDAMPLAGTKGEMESGLVFRQFKL